MNLFLPANGQLENPTSRLLTSTGVEDVYSIAAGKTEQVMVVGMSIVNRHSSTVKVTVWWTKDATDYAIFERVMAANETVVEALSFPLLFYAKATARKIRAQAATADVVTVTIATTFAGQSGIR